MRTLPRTIANDRRGVAGILVAIGIVPIAGTIVAAVDIGLKSTQYAQVWDVAQIACSRVTAPALASAPTTDREAAAEAVLDHHLPMTEIDMATAVATAQDSGTGLTVSIDGELRSLTAGLAASTTIAVSINCDGSAGSSAAGPTLVFFDSFETPDVRDSGYSGWYVEPYLPNWTLLSGSGAQVTRLAIGDPLVYDGFQLLDLDSDTSRGALPSGTTNSAIARTVSLAAGNYRLTYGYHRHPLVADPADHTVAVYVDRDLGPPPPRNEVHRSSTMAWGWQNEVVDFTISKSGVYHIGFAALGTANRMGGFIDAVQLEHLP